MNYHDLDFQPYQDEISFSEAEDLVAPRKTCRDWANCPAADMLDLSTQCNPIGTFSITIQVNLAGRGLASLTIPPSTPCDPFSDYFSEKWD